MISQAEVLGSYLKEVNEAVLKEFYERAEIEYHRENTGLSPNLDIVFFALNSGQEKIPYYVTMEDLYQAEDSVQNLNDVCVALLDISDLQINHLHTSDTVVQVVRQYFGSVFGAEHLYNLGMGFSDKALDINYDFYQKRKLAGNSKLSLISDNIDIVESYQEEAPAKAEEKVSLTEILELEQVVLEKLLYNLEHPEELTEYEQLKIMDDSAHIIKRILETEI